MVKCLQEAKVLWNRRQGSGCYRMGFQCDVGIATAAPGQFIMVRLKGQKIPMLRRPFSIHQVIKEGTRIKGFEILYKVVGQGTALLADSRAGEGIDVLGPLGRGFSLNSEHKTVFCIAGGIGVAPFMFLISRMLEAGFDMSRVAVFLGGRSRNDLLCTEDFKAVGVSLTLTTDDGSRGQRGLVTSPLEAAVKRSRPDMLYACGPVPMLQKVIALSKDYDLACQVSVETVMACGMGACLGCAVEGTTAHQPYRHACVDGPVFDAEDIILR